MLRLRNLVTSDSDKETTEFNIPENSPRKQLVINKNGDVETGRTRRHSMDELKRLAEDINTGIDSITLLFKSKSIENQYRDHIFTKNLRLLRLSLICGLVLFILSVLEDLYTISKTEDIASVFVIRGLTIGAIGFYLLLTYLWPEILKRFYQYWVFLLAMLIGTVIIVIGLVSEDVYAPNVVLSLMLQSIFLYTLVGARYLVALTSAIITTVLYILATLLYSGYQKQYPGYVLFLIGCNLVVLISCYNSEFYIRKEFLLRKEAQRAEMSMMLVRQHEEMSVAKTRFVANVSHELRTPLHGIIGMAQSLAQTKLDDEQHEFCDIILTSAEALVRITNDILDISKVEQKGTDAFDLEMKKFSVVQLVEDVIDVVAWKAYSKGIEIASFVSPKIPTELLGDPNRLRQIVLNIASNAVKFTDKGHVIVSVKLQISRDDEVVVCFEVIDSGIGISEEGLNALFQRFSQVDNSNSRKFGGTGLGLYISKQLVEAMGGTISVESTEGVGTVFTFTLPFRRPSSSEDTIATATTSITVLPATRERSSSVHTETTIRITPALPLSRTSLNLHQLNYRKRSGIVSYENAEIQKIVRKYLAGVGVEASHSITTFQALQEYYKNKTQEFLDTIEVVILQYSEASFNFAMELTEAKPQLKIIFIAKHDGNVATNVRHHFSLLYAPLKYIPLIKAVMKGEGRARSASTHSLTPPNTGENSIPAMEQEEDEQPRDYTKTKILLAEDNLVNQKVAQNMLKKFGFQCKIVNNGKEAVDILQTEQYDIILMDCQMPIMDGFEATRKIRALEKEKNTKSLPIIALTANGMEDAQQTCMACGMNDYLLKPFSPSDLKDCIVRNLR